MEAFCLPQVNQQWHRPPASLSKWCSDCREYRGRTAATKTAPVKTEMLRNQKCPTCHVACSSEGGRSWFSNATVNKQIQSTLLIESEFELAVPQAWEIHHNQTIFPRSFQDKEHVFMSQWTQTCFRNRLWFHHIWEGQRNKNSRGTIFQKVIEKWNATA